MQIFKFCRFLKCWILPVETAEPTNVSWTRDERNQIEDKLMSNQTSDIITEENGDFSKSRKQPSLSAASPFLHLSRYVSVSETFPFQAKRREKAENTTWIMKVLCLILQSIFRTRGVDPYLEYVSRRSWCFTATSVAILSTPTCHLLAQKTGVCCKMSSGTDKNINKAFVFFFFLSWKNFVAISEIWSKVFKR